MWTFLLLTVLLKRAEMGGFAEWWGSFFKGFYGAIVVVCCIILIFVIIAAIIACFWYQRKIRRDFRHSWLGKSCRKLCNRCCCWMRCNTSATVHKAAYHFADDKASSPTVSFGFNETGSDSSRQALPDKRPANISEPRWKAMQQRENPPDSPGRGNPRGTRLPV